jgi:hypothetical protein
MRSFSMSSLRTRPTPKISWTPTPASTTPSPEGDPNSPWLFGNTPAALAGPFTPTWAGCSTASAPLLPASPLICSPTTDIVRISKRFPLLSVASLVTPGAARRLITMSWWGALTALYRAGFVRVAVLLHITWSINSICHVIGDPSPSPHRAKPPDSGRWRSCP